jgi:hypothetical protein
MSDVAVRKKVLLAVAAIVLLSVRGLIVGGDCAMRWTATRSTRLFFVAPGPSRQTSISPRCRSCTRM